jgi:hypothetical protein
VFRKHWGQVLHERIARLMLPCFPRVSGFCSRCRWRRRGTGAIYFDVGEKIPLQLLVAIRNWSDPSFVSLNFPPFVNARRKSQLAAGPKRICSAVNRASKSVPVVQMTPRLSAQRPSPVLVNSIRREPLFSTIDITRGFPSSIVVSSHFSGKMWLPSITPNSPTVAAHVGEA